MFKKYLSLALTVALLVVLAVGCDGKASVAEKKFVDKTISVDSFDPNDFSSKIIESMSPSFSKLYKDQSELYEVATNVVYGTVKDTAYFDESGAAHILYDFAIDEVYKGSLNEGDVISVLTLGGYVRLSKYIEVYGNTRFEDYTDEQINATVMESDNMGIPTPEVGDKYLLFLSDPIADEAPFPNGAYVEKGSFMGRYAEQGDEFVRYKPESEPDFYLGAEEKISKTSVEVNFKKAKDEIK